MLQTQFETVQYELDAQGLLCPEPVMMLHSIMRKAQSGDLIRIVCTDPSSLRDIPKFCHFLGHSLVEQLNKGDEQYAFVIEKGR